MKTVINYLHIMMIWKEAVVTLFDAVCRSGVDKFSSHPKIPGTRMVT